MKFGKEDEKQRRKKRKTRTNWPRQVRELILNSDSWSQGVKGRPTGTQGGKGYAYRVSGGQGVGLQGPVGSWNMPTGPEGVRV